MRIDAVSVSMIYNTREGPVRALDGIDFEVLEGQFFALVGPSGCGKSTLLNLTAGLRKPTAGEILIGRRRVTSARTDIGYMFQSPVLLPWKSVLDNVLLQATLRGLDRKEYRERGRQLLAQVGLEGAENRYTFELSGGMQQRVAFCRAVLHGPSVLLMDEPFGALDAITRERMGRDLERAWLSQGAQTVLFVTHSIPEAVLLADRVAVLSTAPARVLKVIDVPLSRPRTQEVMTSPAFGDITRAVRQLINTEPTFTHGGV